MHNGNIGDSQQIFQCCTYRILISYSLYFNRLLNITSCLFIELWCGGMIYDDILNMLPTPEYPNETLNISFAIQDEYFR